MKKPVAVPRIEPEPCRTLAELGEKRTATILGNPDRKSREMGLASGAHVRVLRNRRLDHALVIALGDTRFLVSRAIAAQMAVGELVEPEERG